MRWLAAGEVSSLRVVMCHQHNAEIVPVTGCDWFFPEIVAMSGFWLKLYLWLGFSTTPTGFDLVKTKNWIPDKHDKFRL